jgi:hypothetical protein
MTEMHADEPAATPKQAKSWMPTRKWWTNVVTLLGAVLTSGVTTGWDQTEWTLLIALGVTAATTYTVPNSADNTNSP